MDFDFFFKFVLLSLIHPKMKVRASNSEYVKKLQARKVDLRKFPELDRFFQSRHHIHLLLAIVDENLPP